MTQQFSNKKHKNRERKNEAYSITSKLYYFLQSHPDSIIFKKLSGSKTGDYMIGDEEIRLDYRREIIPTLIHEFIHHLNPNMCESKVIAKEKHIMAIISPKQCVNILRALASCVQISRN